MYFNSAIQNEWIFKIACVPQPLINYQTKQINGPPQVFMVHLL